jgi:hypothetical protein
VTFVNSGQLIASFFTSFRHFLKVTIFQGDKNTQTCNFSIMRSYFSKNGLTSNIEKVFTPLQMQH